MGKPTDYTWLGLLPSYLERPDSSLVDMVQYFMTKSNQPGNKFYALPRPDLIHDLEILKAKNEKAILMGVSFALLDLFEQYSVPLWDELLIIETGGMKGRKTEITREELYERIRAHHVDVRIASEYGMTELLSQAYMMRDQFYPGPTMKILIRDISDPGTFVKNGKRGAINIIDLGNLDTCSFLATDDIGIVYDDGEFDVLGRIDQSDLRGCNLMYT